MMMILLLLLGFGPCCPIQRPWLDHQQHMHMHACNALGGASGGGFLREADQGAPWDAFNDALCLSLHCALS